MTNRDIKEEVLNRLKTLPVCIPNNEETQWTVRCPFCGDSSDLNHGHLSILIDRNNDETPMLFRCFKCETSGMLNANLMAELGCPLDGNLNQALKKSARKSSGYNRFTNEYIMNYVVPIAQLDGITFPKLQYISNRLGYQMSPEEASSKKIILDLYQFMDANKIWIGNLKKWQVENLQNFYVSFLSSNNNILISRCIIPKEDQKFAMKRYLKAPIIVNNTNPNSFYSIPASVNVMSIEPINIHIAEGTFDILSIQKNIPCNGTSLYFASCGFCPMTIIQYLVYTGLGYHLNLHLYCDNDKSDKDEIWVLKKHPEMIPWIDEIYFHRNSYSGEKDYGVPKDHIIDNVRKARIL